MVHSSFKETLHVYGKAKLESSGEEVQSRTNIIVLTDLGVCE